MLRYLPILLLLSSCYADELQNDMNREPFFDLAGYIDRQVDSLQGMNGTVTKTITLNGTTETKELSDLQFGNDLRVFREADINKPAWLDKYETDQSESDGLLTRTYTALDSSMQTRKLTVTSRDGQPVGIEIIRKTGTVLSDGWHRLVYEPASGYALRTIQKNTFGDDLDADIRVSW
ncbi:hypothetical protein [Lewinella sp. IMCC34191]|uniref:hypothetical protein n=1 Tax=Lewinella sp. IMCC34191 TaxID=2259172 RepID=UPI000E27F6C3|nr:hypothetical protein [Lewinella sp. IMCC34191]